MVKKIWLQCRRPKLYLLGLGRSPGEGNAIHSSILAWRIPWTKEPKELQSTGSQRVRYDWATNTHTHTHTHTKSQWGFDRQCQLLRHNWKIMDSLYLALSLYPPSSSPALHLHGWIQCKYTLYVRTRKGRAYYFWSQILRSFHGAF